MLQTPCVLLEFQHRLQDLQLILLKSMWGGLEIWDFFVSLTVFENNLWNMPSPKNTLCWVTSVQAHMCTFVELSSSISLKDIY